VDLIYPKGAYILHMVRMMMWSAKNGDQNFRDTMHDFVQTYSGKPASTEDFKAMVEKHMTPEMDLDGNRRMTGSSMNMSMERPCPPTDSTRRLARTRAATLSSI
jgi:hypothetical protein